MYPRVLVGVSWIFSHFSIPSLLMKHQREPQIKIKCGKKVHSAINVYLVLLSRREWQKKKKKK